MLTFVVTRVGDFYLTRSIYGDFSVQSRQYLCHTGVSCNSGVRIQYGRSSLLFDRGFMYVFQSAMLFVTEIKRNHRAYQVATGRWHLFDDLHLLVPRRSYTEPICVQSATLEVGLRIYRVGTSKPSWVIVLPDTSVIILSCCPVNIWIHLASTRRGTMVGLCGTNDHNVTNDAYGADGVNYRGALPARCYLVHASATSRTRVV